MTLALTRRWQTGNATMGTLTVDGSPLCYVLEDRVRTKDTDGDGDIDAVDVAEFKVPGETAIPAGTYRVEMDQSPRFGRVPHIRDVPGFTHILIHAGNVADHTRGCILVGMTRQPAALEQSRVALSLLIPHLERAEAHSEPITIEIRESFGGLSA